MARCKPDGAVARWVWRTVKEVQRGLGTESRDGYWDMFEGTCRFHAHPRVLPPSPRFAAASSARQVHFVVPPTSTLYIDADVPQKVCASFRPVCGCLLAVDE